VAGSGDPLSAQSLAANDGRSVRRVGLPVTIQSENDVKGDSPAYAWLTALLTTMTDPLMLTKSSGVLREIFGASDHDLTVFSRAESEISHRRDFIGDRKKFPRSYVRSRKFANAQRAWRYRRRYVDHRANTIAPRLLLLPATESAISHANSMLACTNGGTEATE